MIRHYVSRYTGWSDCGVWLSSIYRNPLNKGALLFQLYFPSDLAGLALELSQKLRHVLPDAVIIGGSSAGEIVDGKACTGAVVISATVFEFSKVSVCALPVTQEAELEQGEELASFCLLHSVEAELKGALLLATALNLNCKRLLHGVAQVLQCPVFGGSPGHYGTSEQSWLLHNDWLSSTGAVLVCFFGSDLDILLQSHLGWQAVGREFVATEVEKNRIVQLDQKPALMLYQRYLGIDTTDEFFSQVLDFPLMLKRGGKDVIRVPINAEPEGALVLLSDIESGEVIRLGYGDVDQFLDGNQRSVQQMAGFSPQAIYLYLCGSRRGVMQEHIEHEIKPYEELAPAVGLFTFGEFLAEAEGWEVHNGIHISVGLREKGRGKVSKLLPAEPHSVASDVFSNRHLNARRRLTCLLSRLTEELQQSNRELEEQAEKDALTGLYNRRAFDKRLASEVARQQRHRQDMAVILFDIDFFKGINDQFGHQAGDEVLRTISRVATGLVRDTDTLARYGGEEFILLLPQCSLEAAGQIAERFRHCIAAFDFSQCGFGLPRITCSFGVAAGLEPDQLTRQADIALYQSKDSGRNCVTLFNTSKQS